MRRRVSAALVGGALAACAACSSSGGSAPPVNSGGGTGSAAVASANGRVTAASTPASRARSGAAGGGITLSGAFTATVTATLCTSGIASIAVHVDGDAQDYRGSISATSFGFVGPDAADYSLKSGRPEPTVSADGTTFTVRGVQLADLVSGATLTADGSVTCP